MTVGELREYLEDLPEDVEVRLQTQPNYPIEHGGKRAILRSELPDENGNPQGLEYREPECLYLVEGEWIGYGTKWAWERTYG